MDWSGTRKNQPFKIIITTADIVGNLKASTNDSCLFGAKCT